MSVSMQVNSLPEKKSSRSLWWGAGIGAAIGGAWSGTGVALSRSAWKKEWGIDSFESAQKFIKNYSGVQLGPITLSRENFLKSADNIFKSSGKHIAKTAAVCGVIGLAIGGLVALAKRDKN